MNRIRILDAEHFKQTEQLAEECTNFNDSQQQHEAAHEYTQHTIAMEETRQRDNR